MQRKHYPATLCRALFLMAVLLPLLFVLADAGLRARGADRQTRLWFNALDLSCPALWPAGTPMRHPETLWPGMDLRFTPLQPAGPQYGDAREVARHNGSKDNPP